MVNAIGVTFESNGEKVEAVSLPKTDFDALLLERKLSRWAIGILMVALIATSGTIWLADSQPRVTVIAAPQSK